MAQRKRSRNSSFLSEAAKKSTAGESGLEEASSVCLMAREVELAANFINDFAEELIHVCSHVIHNALKNGWPRNYLRRITLSQRRSKEDLPQSHRRSQTQAEQPLAPFPSTELRKCAQHRECLSPSPAQVRQTSRPVPHRIFSRLRT